MKSLSTIIFFAVLSLFLSCKTKSGRKSDEILSVQAGIKPTYDSNIVISLTSELRFRRSFADAQFMDDSNEIERYYNEQEKSNPLLEGYKYDTVMKKRFEALGMVKEEELLAHVLKKTSTKPFHFVDSANKKIAVFFTPESSHPDTKPSVIGRDSCQIIFFPLGDFSYILQDIIPGGNKEVVVLEQNYFMNGYFFDLKVYEIKRGKIAP